jgi:single-stranded DNA-binding protein
VYICDEGSIQKATFIVKVMRRPFLVSTGQIAGGKLFIDLPLIASKNYDIAKTISELEEGDMADVKGVFTTKEARRSSICGECSNKNSRIAVTSYVTAIYVCRRETGITKDQGIELLRERTEVSNNVLLLGTLCKDPHHYVADDNRDYTQYQLAINRKYHIRDDQDYNRTDYPWIKAFGKQAKQDSKVLSTNSTVMINGAIQSRPIEKAITCELCKHEYTSTEQVFEVVPYSVEYLTNCDTDNLSEAEPASKV